MSSRPARPGTNFRLVGAGTCSIKVLGGCGSACSRGAGAPQPGTPALAALAIKAIQSDLPCPGLVWLRPGFQGFPTARQSGIHPMATLGQWGGWTVTHGWGTHRNTQKEDPP